MPIVEVNSSGWTELANAPSRITIDWLGPKGVWLVLKTTTPGNANPQPLSTDDCVYIDGDKKVGYAADHLSTSGKRLWARAIPGPNGTNGICKLAVSEM